MNLQRDTRRLVGCLVLLWTFTGWRLAAQNDIENVRVETYYISDTNDATDTIGGGLAAGSRTYRIHIDLAPGRRLRALYGRAGHPIRIESTALLFNHTDRGRRFGHEVNNSALDEGVVALDSWLSLGAASSQRMGVRKELDTDGSTLGGANNDGGSAGIAAGLLNNTTEGMGIALTVQDGLVPHPNNIVPPNFLRAGDDPVTAFGDSTQSSGFVSEDFRMSCSTPGVSGVLEGNELLVAQITTTGELSFSLNIEIELANGSLVRYVAADTTLAEDETPSGLLRWPPQCGCTDPEFLEYDPTAGCDDGSCATTIVFGCLDDSACNYDGTANFHLAQLCCYGPGQCNGLDVELLCPDVGVDPVIGAFDALVAPNPVMEGRIRILNLRSGTHAYLLADIAGRSITSGGVIAHGDGVVHIDAPMLHTGTYFLVIHDEDGARTHRVIVP